MPWWMWSLAYYAAGLAMLVCCEDVKDICVASFITAMVWPVVLFMAMAYAIKSCFSR
jgi:hypothetical protein